jgi:XTP/dITP diphosphohydrolase
MKLRCATSNPGKLREFRMAATHWGFSGVEIEPLDGLRDIPPPEENGVTFEENAAAKALYYSGFTADAVFADDSGLSVDALNGEPGVYSARYAGVDATDAANNALVRERLRDQPDRTGRFVCVIALARQGELLGLFRGEVEGTILDEERGPHGFGYDPMFFYPPFACTFGEVEASRKMAVSHRGQALRLMLEQAAHS